MHICPFPKQVKVSKIFFICLEEKLNFCSIIFFKQNTYVWLTFSQFSNHNCNKKMPTAGPICQLPLNQWFVTWRSSVGTTVFHV